MKKCVLLFIAFGIVLGVGGLAKADTVDIVTAPDYYFAPAGSEGDFGSGYFRFSGGDWGWEHKGISTPFNSATLTITAYDVDSVDPPTQGDATYPEIDMIRAWDNGTGWVDIGSLTGSSDALSSTSFVLDSRFFDDIVTGLQLWIDIDSTYPGVPTLSDGWGVSLSKSVLTVSNSASVPEPSTLLLIGGGLVGLAAPRKRLRKA